MPVQFNEAYFLELGRSPAVVNLVVGIAQEIAADARASAPVDSGDYRNGIHVEVKLQKRVVAVVKASDKKSLLIESKTGNLVRALNRRKRRARA
jgi:hypothetical protein